MWILQITLRKYFFVLFSGYYLSLLLSAEYSKYPSSIPSYLSSGCLYINISVPTSTVPYQNPNLSPSLKPNIRLYTDTNQAYSNKPSRVPYSVPLLEHYYHPIFIRSYAPSKNTYTYPNVAPTILLSHNLSSVSQLFLSVFLYADPSQYPINKSSCLPYAVPSVEHYFGPGYSPTYEPSEILSRAPSIVPDTSPSHKIRLVYSFVTSSIPTTHAIQYFINHNSIFPSALLIVGYYTIDTSTTQKRITKELFSNSNINDYIYVAVGKQSSISSNTYEIYKRRL